MYERFDYIPENAIFEWDDNKEQKKYEIHGIHFKTAVKVFLDYNMLIRLDEEHTWEERYNIIGKVGKIIFVVCTFKENNVIRIISVRKASIPEKRRYEHGENYFE